jgi:mannose-6-phosphate isomerase-like protein (cupin superfamily)
MPRSAAIDLSKNPVQFTAQGSIEPVVQKGRAHPAVAGRLAGEARMTKSPPHGGEMHPDGDELLILVEGEIDVVLDEDDGQSVVPLTHGDAFVVPRGMWHRVIVKSPCRLLHFTPGRSQVRRRS